VLISSHRDSSFITDSIFSFDALMSFLKNAPILLLKISSERSLAE